jgi:RNA polymerase sigma-70 factor (ECF subfamily)
MTDSLPKSGSLGDVTARAPEASMRELYDAHGSFLFRYLLRHTRDWHKAEDILQETLVRAWRHPNARSADGEWSRPWLVTVARRIAIDHVRTAMARPNEYGDERLEERPALDDEMNRLIDIGEVRAALETLPDRLRDVLNEVYIRDRSVAETAEALAVPRGTVKSRTFYALKALREALLERGFNLPDG